MAGGTATGGGSTTGGGSATDGGDPTALLAAAKTAATTAAMTHPRCQAIASSGNPTGFYWELGDRGGPIVWGTRGAYTSSTVRTIASMTKVFTAAYFAERLDGGLDGEAVRRGLNFTSGFVVPEQTCPVGLTVEQCYAQFGGAATFDASKRGAFYYGPNHMQDLAMQFPELAPLSAEALGAEYTARLRLGPGFTFKYAALASGAEVSPVQVRELLVGLVTGRLKLRAALGRDGQCTVGCGYGTSSPSPEPWHYGLGHWIEDGCDAGTCDGARSGLGATGFYGWVDASGRHYGMVGHWEIPLGGPVFMDSAFCGQQIRAAFLDTVRSSAAHCGPSDVSCAPGQVCCDGACRATCE